MTFTNTKIIKYLILAFRFKVNIARPLAVMHFFPYNFHTNIYRCIKKFNNNYTLLLSSGILYILHNLILNSIFSIYILEYIKYGPSTFLVYLIGICRYCNYSWRCIGDTSHCTKYNSWRSYTCSFHGIELFLPNAFFGFIKKCGRDHLTAESNISICYLNVMWKPTCLK